MSIRTAILLTLLAATLPIAVGPACYSTGGGGEEPPNVVGPTDAGADADTSPTEQPDGDATTDATDTSDPMAEETGSTADGGQDIDGQDGGPDNNCPSGFRPEEGECVDIDECAEGTDDCGEDQMCMNTEGSYNCSGGPTIEKVETSTSRLTPGDSVTIDVTVTDPDGGADIAGGKLVDPDTGTLYGPFVIGSGAGGYRIDLTWDKINSVRPIETPAGGGTRTLRIQFQDADGNVGNKQLELELGCADSAQGVCGGSCHDFDTSTDHCGGCGNACTTGPSPNCSMGSCRGCADPDLTLCNGECVDLQNGRDYCGSCSNPVPATMTCVNGALTCPSVETQCGPPADYACQKLETSKSDCGSCGNSCSDWAKRQGVTTGSSVYADCESSQCLIIIRNTQRTSCSVACQGLGLSCTDQISTTCQGGGSGSQCGSFDDPTSPLIGNDEYSFTCSQTPPKAHPNRPNAMFERIRCRCR